MNDELTSTFRDLRRAEADNATLRAALAERDATIARVRAVCDAHKDDGLVFRISIERALDGQP